MPSAAEYAYACQMVSLSSGDLIVIPAVETSVTMIISFLKD